MTAAPSLFEQVAKGWRGYVLIGLIALVSSLFGAASLPVMDRDEARFAQATRQMVETGDYVRIRIQELDRNKKPIGIHWLQAAAVQAASPFTDQLNTIWPYRLPSALGIVLAALATLWAGTRLLGPIPGFLGAALFAAGVLAGFEGMTAKTDAALCGFTALAMAALATLYTNTAAPRKTALVFWFALGCGVLIKGPITPMIAAATLLCLGLWEKRWAWMTPLRWWPGPLIAALIVAPWMIAIGLATEGRFFIDALTQDLAPKLSGGQEGHFAWPGTHLLLLPLLIFPATYALPFAARLGWRATQAPRADEAHAPLRFLIAWAVPSFLLFEFAPTKLWHYTLPLYPAIALLCGAGLFAARRERWGLMHAIGLILFVLFGALIAAILSYGATFMPGDDASDMRRAITLGIVGGAFVLAGLVALLFLRTPLQRAAALVAAALALSYALRAHVMPEARSLMVSSEAVAALTRARLTPRPDRPLWVVGYNETSLVFMTDTAIRLARPETLRAEPGDALVVEGRDEAAVAAALAARGLMFAPAGAPVTGLNVGNGDDVVLHVGTAAPHATPPPEPFSDELAGDPPPDPEPPPASRGRGRR